MEKEGHKREPEELVLEEGRGEEEEEEVGLLLRGSKYNIESETSKEVRNCHVEKNGYANLPSVTENGAQESTFDGDQEEHVDPTPEEAEVKDCLPTLENCVYYDKDEDGKQTSSSSVKESNKRNPGDVSINGSLLTDLQYHGNLKDENLSNFDILPTEPQEPVTIHKLSTLEEIESANVDLITDSEIDTKDYDVENVLHKQNTHDLYCPNCHSCITRRVILRKRKRNIRISSEDVKRNKLETEIESKSDISPTQLNSDQCHDEPLISLDDTPISAANGYHRDSEPEIFRCLSCFSFFIPTGSGFKFPIFCEKGEKENMRDEQQVGMNKSWFSSIFASHKEKGSADQGDPVNHCEIDTNHQLNASNVSTEIEVNDTINESLSPADKTQDSIERLVESTLSASQTGLKILINSNEESMTIEKKQADKMCDCPDDEAEIALTSPVSVLKVSEGETKLDISTETREFQQHTGAVLLSERPIENKDEMFQTDRSHPYEVSEHFISNKKVEIHSKDPLKVDTDYLISSVKDALLIQDKPVNDYNLSKGEVAASSMGEDTIISVEAGPTETAESTNLPNLATEMRVVEQQGTNAREGNKIEIIKSIVYGGLTESITGLSILSSAAAAGTATLYIFALSVANLIGGFLIILNNLWELKQASNQEGDRYREVLGHRENFVIHAIFIVLSYTVFGLVPPTVYGYSFRKSDDKELKLIAAAAASLLCIMVLATGKVYAQRPPKSYLKTVTFYVVLGFMVSGVSFAAGQLMNRLLQKLGLFQSSSEVKLFQSGAIPADAAAWASY